MTLLAPSRLWLLLLCGALAVGYAMLQRRRRHKAVRHPDLALVASVAPRFAGWRRHLTAALLLLTLGALTFGLARPARSMEVPRDEAVVMLTVDLSASMNATDVQPTRLRAAVAAAKKYVSEAPAAYRIGLVGFDAEAYTLATPGTDRARLLDTLDSLNQRVLKHGTRAGDGLHTALEVIRADTEGRYAASSSRKPYSAVVLLSDGATRRGRSLETVAQTAADRSIPVFTIAYGTADGVVIENGKSVPAPADPTALTSVGDISGGVNYTAANAGELAETYDDLGTRIGHVTRNVEMTVALAAVAAALLGACLVTTMLWSPRLV